MKGASKNCVAFDAIGELWTAEGVEVAILAGDRDASCSPQ